MQTEGNRTPVVLAQGAGNETPTIQRLWKSSIFFFFRKISPELTSVCQSSSFCLRKIVPELISVPIYLYFVCGTPPQYGLMSGVWVHTQDPNLQTCATRAECRNLTTTRLGQPPPLDFVTVYVVISIAKATFYLLILCMF